MKTVAAFKFAPLVSDDKKVDVSIKDGNAVIALSNWVDGLGWCGQKTLSVDLDMLDDLQRVITAARLKVIRETPEADRVETPKVLQFPRFQ
ncbi:MAG: hypothetical protein WBD22_03920 [Pyrinomonadaceae bacterium]